MSAPVVVAITPPMVVFPAPMMVRVRVLPAIAPRVSVPASVLTVEFAAIVIAPDQLLAPARLRIAPVPPTPVPLRLVIASARARARPLPSISIAAPEVTVVPPAVEPRALSCCTRMTPALMVVIPVYVLAPDRTRVPVPVLASAPVPAMVPP